MQILKYMFYCVYFVVEKYFNYFLNIQFMRKETHKQVSKFENFSRFLNSIDQYVSYHFNQRKYRVTVLIFSEMLKNVPGNEKKWHMGLQTNTR